MRKFNQKVFDDTLASATNAGVALTPPELNDLLGSVDKLAIMAVGDLPSGTSPTITVQIYHSADGIQWVAKNGTAEINAQTLTANAVTVKVGTDAAATPSLGLVRLQITLGGTTTQAHIKVWVTGRVDG